MSQRKLSEDAVAAQCGKAAEKIILQLVTGSPLVLTLTEDDARRWGFPDVSSMRITMQEFSEALPPSIRHLLTVREGNR